MGSCQLAIFIGYLVFELPVCDSSYPQVENCIYADVYYLLLCLLRIRCILAPLVCPMLFVPLRLLVASYLRFDTSCWSLIPVYGGYVVLRYT